MSKTLEMVREQLNEVEALMPAGDGVVGKIIVLIGVVVALLEERERGGETSEEMTERHRRECAEFVRGGKQWR